MQLQNISRQTVKSDVDEDPDTIVTCETSRLPSPFDLWPGRSPNIYKMGPLLVIMLSSWFVMIVLCVTAKDMGRWGGGFRHFYIGVLVLVIMCTFHCRAKIHDYVIILNSLCIINVICVHAYLSLQKNRWSYPNLATLHASHCLKMVM